MRMTSPRRRKRLARASAAASFSELTRGRPGTRRGDHGATAVEYALMVGMIALVIVAAVTLFGRNVSTLFLVPASVF
ncbi:Flp pilus assembly pilin Flp [Phycicoccus badiiscoriae]|uniref:Flp pilus assembly pilin Flp n=1 Tax=Pedococcus badiiscoriae TaxID=642776 RepID=A0A852WJ98_9MICO|nr:Flp family type IVb pilin [Pedococcus badiiscoriae]NYG07701.1 Flp pilus assembly pilin Flp [Pedococcus badiiscoriae]